MANDTKPPNQDMPLAVRNMQDDTSKLKDGIVAFGA
jgi:hypothetical protein